MTNNYLIYVLQAPNGKLYVGQTKQYKDRMEQHQSKDSNCRYLRRAIKKYKWENIKQHILLKGLSLEQANHWEQHYISIFDCQAPNGYNLKDGGSYGSHSQISKDRISLSLTGRKQTAEHRSNVSKALTGRKQTAEHNNNISKGLKGRVMTAETKTKMSLSHTGRKETYETRVIKSLLRQLYYYEKQLETTMKI